MAKSIDTSARELLQCVCQRLTDQERPACACFATVGPPVIALCCECEEDTSGELTIHLERLYDADPETLAQVTTRVHPCRRSVTAADLTIILTRCYPMVDENGEMPESAEQDSAATLLHNDVSDVYAALICGCSDIRLVVQEVAVDSMPEAGCAVLAARVSVEVAA